MSSQKDYVPVQLIIKIGDRLLAVDGLGHQVYSARYLEKNHLSGRAQCKQSLRAVLRTLIKIYTFAPNFKFGTK